MQMLKTTMFIGQKMGDEVVDLKSISNKSVLTQPFLEKTEKFEVTDYFNHEANR